MFNGPWKRYGRNSKQKPNTPQHYLFFMIERTPPFKTAETKSRSMYISAVKMVFAFTYSLRITNVLNCFVYLNDRRHVYK